MEPAETYEHCGVTVEIHYDETGSGDPREGDNVTTLFCSYPGYELGDEQLPSDGFEEINCPKCQGTGEGPHVDDDEPVAPDCERCDGTGWATPTVHEWANEQGAIAIAPLFVYEHSGITMRAGTVKCLPEGELTRADTASRARFVGDDAGWDTSMVGFAIITNDDWKTCMGDTPRTEERLREIIDSEVESYAMYLEGQVYGYVVAEDTPFADSCWGFLGDDHVKEEANVAAKHAAEQLAEEANERSEMAARDIVTVAA